MVALWLTSCLVLIFVAEANAVIGAACKFSSQCGKRECCAENIMIASKRQVEGDTLRGRFGSKSCHAILTEGQSCNIFASPCGCAPGLTCKAKASAAPVPLESQKMIIGPGSQSTCVRNKKY